MLPRYLLLFLLTISCFLQLDAGWAEQTLQTMTLEEKVGQLFMMRAFSDQNRMRDGGL